MQVLPTLLLNHGKLELSDKPRAAHGGFQLAADIPAVEGGIAKLVAPDLRQRQPRG